MYIVVTTLCLLLNVKLGAQKNAHNRLGDFKPGHVQPRPKHVLRPQHAPQARLADAREGAQSKG